MIEAIILTIITASTPLLLAATGELIAEKSGVLNLGVEGMMIIGAVVGFAGGLWSGSAYFGVLCAMGGGMALSLLFGFLCLYLGTNQVATGLALTIFGLGLSGMVGESYVGLPGVRLSNITIPYLSELPFIGSILFSQNILVYISVGLAIITALMLSYSRWGLTIRAIGDNHLSADSLGMKVRLIRLSCVLFGGACAGLAGGFLSLSYTVQWIEGMTAGRGWIALALVVFASWRPMRVMAGAYLFGAVSILQFHAQALGINVPAQFLASLPFIMTILVLTLISASTMHRFTGSPACLGRPFIPDR